MPSRRTIPATCLNCGTDFFALRSSQRIGPPQFCGTECSKAGDVTLATRLERGLPPLPAEGCREWQKARSPWGYGKIGRNGKFLATHRVAWELANGPIPDGMNVLHRCDNPPCCRTEPDEKYPEGHLFLGTTKNNTQDMIAKGRRRGRAFPSGRANQWAKLTTAQVLWIRSFPPTPNFAELGRTLGLHRSSVRAIYRGETRSRG